MNIIQVNLDTRQATTGTPFNCTLPLGTPVSGNIKRVTLKSVELPVGYYPIRSPYNTFSFVRNSTTYTATVTEGNYTISTLLTALTTALNALSAGTTWGLSYSSTTNKVTATTTATAVVSVSSTWDLALALGFTSGESGASFTATNTYNLNFDLYLSLVIDNLPSSNLSNPPQTFKIPVNVGYGSVFYLGESSTFNQTVYCQGSASHLPNLRIRVLDRWGNNPSNNGLHFSFLLEIETE